VYEENTLCYVKPTLHKELIMSITAYAFPAWEFAADIHLPKKQRPQKKKRISGNFPRRTPLRDLPVALKIYVRL
jgi:hypothetical protein